MAHNLSTVKLCNNLLPKHQALVYFWDTYGTKRLGFYFSTFKFVELNTGFSFKPNVDILCWQYK